jgi:hypothetical protein
MIQTHDLFFDTLSDQNSMHIGFCASIIGYLVGLWKFLMLLTEEECSTFYRSPYFLYQAYKLSWMAAAPYEALLLQSAYGPLCGVWQVFCFRCLEYHNFVAGVIVASSIRLVIDFAVGASPFDILAFQRTASFFLFGPLVVYNGTNLFSEIIGTVSHGKTDRILLDFQVSRYEDNQPEWPKVEQEVTPGSTLVHRHLTARLGPETVEITKEEPKLYKKYEQVVLEMGKKARCTCCQNC